MEKIKKAIESARTGKLIRQPSVISKPSSVVASKTLKKITDDLDDIEYKYTAVTALNPAHLEKHRIVALNKIGAGSSSFDNLRTQVLQKMEENNWKTIAVVSPTSGVGKTVVSINLALSISQQPQKTCVLVDLDLRRPKVAEYMGLTLDKSLNDYIQGDASIDEVMLNPGVPRLVIIPTKNRIGQSAEMLATKKMQTMIQEIRERYESRITIFDLPPVLDIDDVMVLMPQIDCVLLIVGSGITTPDDLKDSLHLIPKDKLLGVVFNQAEVEVRTYY